MILKKISDLKTRIAQMYQDLKTLEEMPFRFIQGDFEDRRVKVRASRKNQVSVEDLKPKKRY